MVTPLAGVTCLVLGAGGFVGLNLCRALASQGAAVHGYGRPPAFPSALQQIQWTNAEFDDSAALARALEGMEVVFHLLGSSIPEQVERDPVRDLRCNSAASVELFRLCQLAGVRRVVFISSGGTVYGVPRQTPIAEDHPTNPISVYGIHKLLIEKHLGLLAYRHGLRTVILRAANPYGPCQRPDRGQGVIATLIARRLAGRAVEIWGDGRVVRDFLHVDDLVRAILAAVHYDGPQQVFNVGSGTGRSILEVLEAIDDVLQLQDAPIYYQPARPVDVPINVLDVSLIQRELGWKARMDWHEGLRGTAAWLRQFGTVSTAVR